MKIFSCKTNFSLQFEILFFFNKNISEIFKKGKKEQTKTKYIFTNVYLIEFV